MDVQCFVYKFYMVRFAKFHERSTRERGGLVRSNLFWGTVQVYVLF